MAPTALRPNEKVSKRTGHGVGVKPFLDDAEGGSASDDIPDKDETEEQLEKLLFGDDAGFFEGLKSHPTGSQLTHRTKGTVTGAEDAEDAEDEDLESVADENVCTSHVKTTLGTLTRQYSTAFLPRFWCRQPTGRLAWYACSKW